MPERASQKLYCGKEDRDRRQRAPQLKPLDGLRRVGCALSNVPDRVIVTGFAQNCVSRTVRIEFRGLHGMRQCGSSPGALTELQDVVILRWKDDGLLTGA